ncbi:MAG: glycosyltransferase [Cyanobacteria bacterium J06623_4]
MVEVILFSLSGLSVVIWLYLLFFWGQFWRADQRLDTPLSLDADIDIERWPAVAVVIPARNEAELIGKAVRSHLNQTYPGDLSIVLIDDQSTDQTSVIAAQVAQDLGKSEALTILPGSPLPPGWTGKLWAMEQGYRFLQQHSPDYILFTDADIEHTPQNTQQLITKAETEGLDLVSLMVQLRCQSFWEKQLIPAFVFFFQMLYPFPWVNNPNRKTAAAAGGCTFIRFSALNNIQGLQPIRHALIDDCALGTAIKANGSIWLGLSTTTRSLRKYPTLQNIWAMVTRSAYTQLNYSPWLLVGTVFGMALVYLLPPISVLLGLYLGAWPVTTMGLTGWLLMAISYRPTLQLYSGTFLQALGLPAVALLYTAMTLDSARQHWAGKGGTWKGRVYTEATER